MLRSLSAVCVLDREPTDSEAETLATEILCEQRPEGLADPRTTLSWFCADTLPPEDVLGIPLHEIDQLGAHLKDGGPEATYFVVMIENNG